MSSTNRLQQLTFFAVIVTVLLSLPSAAQSHVVTAGPARAVVDITKSSNHLWALASCGERAYLFRSSDAGRTWAGTPSNLRMSKLFFLDEERGWALGALDTQASTNVELFQTEDGGQQWVHVSQILHVPPDSSLGATDLLFTDSRHGWIVGERPFGGGLLLKTSDGGAHFQRLRKFDETGATWALFGGPSQGVWVGGRHSLMGTFDNGRSWLSESSAIAPDEFSVLAGNMRPSGTGGIVGLHGGGAIFVTTDSGEHWRLALQPGDVDEFNGIEFYDDDHACAISASRLYCTSNGGRTWTYTSALPQPSGSWGKQTYRKFLMMSPESGWLKSDTGYLFETQDRGVSWRSMDLFELGHVPCSTPPVVFPPMAVGPPKK